jgi:trans-2,3-dihydro-3-hydroxyanthranilate isomerase
MDSVAQRKEVLVNYRYYTCDVFTDARFGGNPLAVLPRAEGLSDRQMQQIAREFNLSETAFVFPPSLGHTRHVRIFTPAHEIPFAGHPNVGTAFVLAVTGELGKIGASLTVTFEEKAGLVPVTIHEAGGKIASCELAAPRAFSIGKVLPPRLLATTVSLEEGDISVEAHPPQVASVGLPFVMTELRDLMALERARANLSGFESILAADIQPSIFLYTRGADRSEIRARMFAPLSGVLEDPATGSAGCALAGLLAHLEKEPRGAFRWRITQGVEMGRPSTLLARAEKSGGKVEGTWIGGACVMVSEGQIHVD